MAEKKNIRRRDFMVGAATAVVVGGGATAAWLANQGQQQQAPLENQDPVENVTRNEAVAEKPQPRDNLLSPASAAGDFITYYGEGNFALNDPAADPLLTESLLKAKLAIVSPEGDTWPADFIKQRAAEGKTTAAVVFMETAIPDTATAPVDIDAVKQQVKAQVKDIQAKGFNGVFLSGMDEAIANERRDPANFKGLTQGLVDAIKEIRQENPDFPILLNRGLEVSRQTAPFVDGIVVTNGFSAPGGDLLPNPDRVWVKNSVGHAKLAAGRVGNDLKIFTIDAPSNAAAVQVAQESAKAGFSPYIAPEDGNLANFVPQPEVQRPGPVPPRN